MLRTSIALALTLVVAPTPARAVEDDRPPPPAAAEPPAAFRLDLKLSVINVGALALGSAGSGSGLTSATGVPQILLGGQLGRFGVLIGVGFERVGNGDSQFTVFTLAPTFTADLVRSADRKVALFALAAAPIGLAVTSGSSASSNSTDTSWAVQVALGARYAVHPNLSVGLEAGPIAQFLIVDRPDSLTIVSMYGALFASWIN